MMRLCGFAQGNRDKYSAYKFSQVMLRSKWKGEFIFQVVQYCAKGVLVMYYVNVEFQPTDSAIPFFFTFHISLFYVMNTHK